MSLGVLFLMNARYALNMNLAIKLRIHAVDSTVCLWSKVRICMMYPELVEALKIHAAKCEHYWFSTR